MDGLELCVARPADSLEPPRQTVSEWADQNRRLSSEASAERGEWRTDRAPYQRAIMSGMPPLFLGIKVNEVAGEAAGCGVRDVAELIGCREVGSGHPSEPRGRSLVSIDLLAVPTGVSVLLLAFRRHFSPTRPDPRSAECGNEEGL